MTHLGPREGITTGLIGAAIVAAFYLVLDTVNGTPLLTPSILGEVLVLRAATALARPSRSATPSWRTPRCT